VPIVPAADRPLARPAVPLTGVSAVAPDIHLWLTQRM
jgi:hypothetical protein